MALTIQELDTLADQAKLDALRYDAEQEIRERYQAQIEILEQQMVDEIQSIDVSLPE